MFDVATIVARKATYERFRDVLYPSISRSAKEGLARDLSVYRTKDKAQVARLVELRRKLEAEGFEDPANAIAHRGIFG